MIRFENVSFNYNERSHGKVFEFKNFNLNISSGEYISLIGSNGSGKTTLALMAKGLLLPFSGKVFYEDKSTTDTGSIHTIGYIFSNPENQMISSLVEEDVAFGPENQWKSTQRIRTSVLKALYLGGIFHLQNGLTHLLSGGEQQKVVIAGILSMDVKCIIFDEAASMLDPTGKRELMQLLHKLNKEEQITIIHITHQFEDTFFSKRVIALDMGEIIFDGSPHTLIAKDEIIERLGMNRDGGVILLQKLLQNRLISEHNFDDVNRIADAIIKNYKYNI